MQMKKTAIPSTPRYEKSLVGRPLRLPTHNYGWTGTYLVTLQAEPYAPSFEDPALRRILEETWQALPRPFPGLALDTFVIGPQQVRFILSFEGNTNRTMTLGRVVESFKSLVAVAWLAHLEQVRAPGPTPPLRIWQRSYSERYLHDEREVEEVRQALRSGTLPAEPEES
ncbi:hypothetical protein KTAU_41610 [Thermogemmatispora aurantia]|uniref:hypothetical protein n=1 Tax=Thermogemmatispora aurantia TaxID=2045279 RepID=UPI00124EE567|nr:hypothetical protein [Thermogemmatispora aurantia]GER85526.1 hypothetical protein KTAU_41610 [Thermogemmatispora aurantia]